VVMFVGCEYYHVNGMREWKEFVRADSDCVTGCSDTVYISATVGGMFERV